MTIRFPDFFADRINFRVPGKTLDGQLGMSKGVPVRMDFQKPGVAVGSPGGVLATAVATNIINVISEPGNGVAFTPANFATGALPMAVPDRGLWGRCLQFVASGANVSVLEVVGRDYLGQKLVKRNLMNGATPVTTGTGATDTAFWLIESITVISGSGAQTISVGTQNKFGVPSAVTALIASYINDVSVAAHTIVLRTLTVQSNATVDPKGLVTFSSAPDSVRTFGIDVTLDYTQLDGVAQNTT